VTYSDNVDAGTAHASASFAGDANHDPSDGAATFAIAQATSTVAVDCPDQVLYTGVAQEPCSASVTGAGGLDASLPVDYAGNLLGTATASGTFDGDRNHAGSSGSATFQIVFGWAGFDQPLEGRGAGAATNGFKAGRMIPIKFALGDAAGTVVLQTGDPTFARS